MTGPAALRIGTIIVLAAVALGTIIALRYRRTTAPKDKMAPLDHVEELRRRLLVSVSVWIGGVMIAFGTRIEMRGDWPVPVLAVSHNIAAQVFGIISDHLVPDGVTLVVTRPIDGFVAELYIAMGLAFLFALPTIMWQIGRFVGPALAARERRTLRNLFAPILVLFLAGATFAWLWVLPFLLETLYGYAAALGAQSLLSISELVGFTVTMILVFGVSFQTPLVMYGLARIGLVQSRTFLKIWRHAIVAIVIFSAIVTDPTVVSQAMVAGPLILLYFGGIGAARLAEKRA